MIIRLYLLISVSQGDSVFNFYLIIDQIAAYNSHHTARRLRALVMRLRAVIRIFLVSELYSSFLYFGVAYRWKWKWARKSDARAEYIYIRGRATPRPRV